MSLMYTQTIMDEIAVQSKEFNTMFTSIAHKLHIEQRRDDDE